MPPADRISTGTAGLDTIIDGGLISNRSYLIRGSPGTGKTMIGLHFLLAGAENGDTEDVLCINLEESTADITRNAESVGLDLSPVEFLDMSPSSDLFRESQNYSIFSPDEVDQESFADEVTARIEEIEPSRVFIDPITRLRHLVPDEYQFRQQVISFMRFLQNMDTTVMFTSQHMEGASDDLQFLSDGTFHLENTEHGRTISVQNFAVQTPGGAHTRFESETTASTCFPASRYQSRPPMRGWERSSPASRRSTNC